LKGVVKLEQTALTGIRNTAFPVVKHCSSAKERRDCIFVTNEGIEVHARFALCFNHADKAIETSETVQLVCMTQFCSIEGLAKKSQRLVVGFQRHWMRVAILTAMGECETGGIAEATGSAVNDFGNERERLQCAWPKLFE
jgi:hypothetical protein